MTMKEKLQVHAAIEAETREKIRIFLEKQKKTA